MVGAAENHILTIPFKINKTLIVNQNQLAIVEPISVNLTPYTENDKETYTVTEQINCTIMHDHIGNAHSICPVIILVV